MNNKKHTDYEIVNREWVLYDDNNHTLGTYLHLKLDVKNADNKLDRYMGIRHFYIRNEYGYEYLSSKSVNGILAGRHMMDPWNREFLVFPYDVSIRVGNHEYKGYFGYNVYKTVYNNEVKGVVSDIKHNVMLLTTTVNGSSVYCVDILAGMYGK
jgi:hypothetical protein